MTMQRFRRFLPFVLGQRTLCHSITSFTLLVLIIIGLPALSNAQQTCQPDGDVDQSGSVTAADALLVFQQTLNLNQLNTCQLNIADVFPQPATPDGNITASDALCIFQKALGLPSCLDIMPLVSAGGDHTCGILDTGAVACWGLDDDGQSAPPAGTFTTFSAGADHTCGILDTGAVACWGLDDDGQSTPPAGTFTMVSAGADHTCGILDTGAVACWGLDDDGQSTPPAGTFTMVSTGADHTCGILDTGAVVCWGLDDDGQSTPPAGTFAMVSTGADHTCGILDTGAVACWGLDDDGQSTPPAGTFTMVSAGADHTCGILDTGAVACWGLDDDGQSTPPAGTFTMVSAGADHTCGILDTGAAVCWGLDDDGQSAPSARATTPNLEVGSPTVDDTTPETGATFALSATVTNTGDAESAATTLRYYRSTDATITTSDTAVGTDAVGALSASGISAQSISLTAPATAGTYYYGACVDAVTDESDTTDNCSASVKVDVGAPARPDLEVGTPTVDDATPETGAPFTLSATVTNTGDAESAATTLRYYRSTDATITASDTAVGTDAVGALSASGSSAQSISLTAPATAGTYYYGVCVDAVTDESDTTDNCSASVQVDVGAPARPDLEVATPTVDDATPETGAPFTLSATVTNTGDAESAATTLRYYRSTDATITASDTAVGTDAVGALSASGSSAQSISLTAPATAGTYYYGVCVDAVTDESDTTDNCSASVQVDVGAPARPDLEVGTPTVDDATPETGAPFTLSATVTNTGDAESAATTLRYYRSTDATITASDTAVGTDAVGALSASGSSAQSISLTAPATAGTYYYGVCVDAVTDESDTTDNCSASVQVDVGAPARPDLEVGTPTVDDATPETGAPFTLSATVTNTGDAESAATTLRYYRSTDATITTSDTEVGTDAVGALSASGISAQSISLTAPATAGTYYYGACVDVVTDESDTTDNCSASVKVDVEEPAQPSAASVEVTAPQEWAPVGGTVTYTASVLDNEGEEMSGYTFTWSSSDTTKATVDSSGVVTAKAVGEATITATASATTSVTVNARSLARNFGAAGAVPASNSESILKGSLKMDVVKPVARIVLSPSSLSFDAVGEVETVTATLYDSDDNEMSPTYWGWSSADKEVAEVYSQSFRPGVSARVQSIGEGTTMVTLHANGTSQSMNVTVTLPTARVDISPQSLTFEALGDTKSVTVKVLDENGDEDEDATWGYFAAFSPCCRPNIPDPPTPPNSWDIEKTDDGLNITAEGPGSGQITISSTDVESAILGVTVYMKPASVVVSPSSADLEVDGTTTLTATIEDANGNSIHVNQDDGRGGRVVYWETSDSAVATVEGSDATEDRNTGATATVTAIAAGSATITASHGSSSYRVSNTATVTVEEPARPDVEVATPTVDDTTPETGATFMLSATVSNAGDAESAATTLRYYRSTDATITASDTAVGTDAVGALAASGTSAQSILLTAPSTAGTYYYGACVDAVTDESDTTNNCSSSVQVDVEAPTYPDLEVGTPSVDDTTPETGASFTLSATVSNTGDLGAPATTLRYYRSTDGTITTSDTEVGTDAVGALAASGTSAESISLTAPSTAGTYYYGACVDAVTGESSTTNNCSASVQVDVEATTTQSRSTVEVTAPQKWAPVGSTATYTARVLDSEGEEIDEAGVTWSSSATAVATVDTNGVVMGLKVGKATITATATVSTTTSSSAAGAGRAASLSIKSAETVSGSATMDVVKRAARIEVTPDSLSFTEVGEGWVGSLKDLTATVYDADNNVMQPTYWVWSSSDEEVVTVRPFRVGTALVQSIWLGTATVTVTANASATVSISVSVAVTIPSGRVQLSPRSLTFDALGDTKTVTVQIFDEDGDEDEDAWFNYSTFFSRSTGGRIGDGGLDITKVDGGLEITANETGTASVEVFALVHSYALKVTVKQNPHSLEVSPDSVSLAVGGTATLTSRVKDSNGHDIQLASGDQEGLVVSWATSDSAVATVDGADDSTEAETGATATVTAAASGAATITGSWVSGSDRLIDTATVTVTDSSN